ncbi:hypothetical protein HZZ13_14225 [Bradyrhizobium sp. CNPSo 4010]|uniref:Uncharacterized protein n=1 Tax=Bradyrhizobium agreste TaxID=2751811 RepID=A0ABS0PP05_9BRAD|nr:hypothetical protein [Bradyrhizobium agreste]MBH5398934.1 hypothetical protein [Bradyrhizobium agreste]
MKLAYAMCCGRCQQKPVDVCKARRCDIIDERRIHYLYDLDDSWAHPIKREK